MNRKVNNASYVSIIDVGAGKMRQALWYFVNVFFFKNPLNIFSGVKVFLLKSFGAKMGKGIVIKPSVNIKYPWKLSVGDFTWIGEGVWIDNLSVINIGNSVTISQGALILTGSHDHTKESFDFISLPVTLEDGVWIGAKAVVYGGVICFSHCILGINAVAESNLSAYTIYKGNPAIAVMKRQII